MQNLGLHILELFIKHELMDDKVVNFQDFSKIPKDLIRLSAACRATHALLQPTSEEMLWRQCKGWEGLMLMRIPYMRPGQLYTLQSQKISSTGRSWTTYTFNNVKLIRVTKCTVRIQCNDRQQSILKSQMTSIMKGTEGQAARITWVYCPDDIWA